MVVGGTSFEDDAVRSPGCADVMDIGETSYSMVLADDLNGDGRTDLLVTTMNGNVYAFQTGAKHHPLASWTSQACPSPHNPRQNFRLPLETLMCDRNPLRIHSSCMSAL